MDSFLFETDAIIDRTTGDYPVINLCDDEGTEVFRFPVSWSDEQVLLALRFANLLFDRGLRMGKLLKLQEIRTCPEMHLKPGAALRCRVGVQTRIGRHRRPREIRILFARDQTGMLPGWLRIGLWRLIGEGCGMVLTPARGGMAFLTVSLTFTSRRQDE